MTPVGLNVSHNSQAGYQYKPLISIYYNIRGFEWPSAKFSVVCCAFVLDRK